MPPPSNGGSGHQVDQPEEQVEPGQQGEQVEGPVADRELVRGGHLAGDAAGADDAHRAVGVALLQAERGAGHVVELLRQVARS